MLSPTARGQDALELANAVWTDSVDRETKQFDRIYRLIAKTKQLYLWTQFKGSPQFLDALRKSPDGSVRVRHIWYRYDFDRWVSTLDQPLEIGRKADLTKLGYEVDAKGFFLWNTWSGHDDLGRGRWHVEIVYGESYEPVMCRRAGVEEACSYAIEVR
jgi:hypothetical protein